MSTVPPPAPSTGNKLEAFVQQHKVQLGVGAGAAVGGLALVMRRRAGSSTPAADPSAAAAPAGAAVSGYAPQGGGSVYSSGVNDFYDAIQPTLEQIQNQINQLNKTPPGPTSPTPAKPVTPVPTNPILVRPNAPAPTPTPQQPVLKRYIVKPGDNLSKIAAQFGLPGGRSTGWQPLYGANKATIGADPNKIKPGQTLVIPQV